MSPLNWAEISRSNYSVKSMSMDFSICSSSAFKNTESNWFTFRPTGSGEGSFSPIS